MVPRICNGIKPKHNRNNGIKPGTWNRGRKQKLTAPTADTKAGGREEGEKGKVNEVKARKKKTANC